MRKGIYIYPWDLRDEGAGRVFDRLVSWGINSMSMALAYHAGRFILPHNPVRRVYFPQDGRVYFPVAMKYYRTPLKPAAAAVADDEYLNEITAECTGRNIEFQAWLVLLHNSRLGNRHPRSAVRNVFGDRYPYALCPARPEVREYARGMVHNLLDKFAVKKLFLESLSFMGFEHGYHHEMYGTELSPTQKSLLGFCFCEVCLEKAQQSGIDVEKLTGAVKAIIDGGKAAKSGNSLESAPEISRFIKVRCATVADLLAEINRIAREYGAELDVFGPVFENSCARAAMEGLDLERLNETVRYYALPAGQTAVDLTRQEIESALKFLPAEKIILSLSMKPENMPDKKNFMAKIKLIDEFKLPGGNFYNYGTIPLEKLAWLKEIS